MSISILPCTSSDAAATIDIGMRAFADDPLNRRTMNLAAATPTQLEQFRAWRTGMAELRMSGPGKHYFKAVDDGTREVVGFVGMYAPEGFGGEAGWQSPAPAPDFIDDDAQGEVRAKQRAAREKWVGPRGDVWCESVYLLM